MHNFCTLFDSAYLSRGLVMYHSLIEQPGGYHLYIFAFDDLCYSILDSLSLHNVSVISFRQLENDQLIEAKKTRTRAEYFWTCTSSAIEFCLDKFGIAECTYIDADLFFFNTPGILFEEFDKSGKTVLITEHRYSRLAALFERKRAGRFCVQFINFKNCNESRKVLSAWKNQCLDWCYNRYEDGKFGDQKYLDEWPEKYNNIHIMKHPGGGVAPWNIGQYKIYIRDSKYYGFDKRRKENFELIFFHFHFVRFLENGSIDLGWNYINRSVRNIMYSPYILKILNTEKMLASINPLYSLTFYRHHKSLRETIKTSFKHLTGFNLIKLNNTVLS